MMADKGGSVRATHQAGIKGSSSVIQGINISIEIYREPALLNFHPFKSNVVRGVSIAHSKCSLLNKQTLKPGRGWTKMDTPSRWCQLQHLPTQYVGIQPNERQ